jgi:large subunit ribosomal protein L2
MVVKSKTPYTPSRRYMVGSEFEGITTNKPEKSLTKGMKRYSGRNNNGRVTSRFRGGGHKRKYRLVDTRRFDKLGIPAKVATIEYDPNRTSWIALLNYADGEKRYVLAWKGITV